ncbi:hypothetical protein C7445_10465 [Alicyclobacillus sacchari]|uniref:Uncharacterized protein n=1 Tax=Alicyclobacillus sacchari TaxID=392010 RepID=A0A4R8LQ01_9BACL|nr:hypothetical protein C7445_10465 [Alicyclobacillus sacchari]GMA58583.1 hypothetical protein GCM10025858_30860 [Alicyclobacillus sacchari]
MGVGLEKPVRTIGVQVHAQVGSRPAYLLSSFCGILRGFAKNRKFFVVHVTELFEMSLSDDIIGQRVVALGRYINTLGESIWIKVNLSEGSVFLTYPY